MITPESYQKEWLLSHRAKKGLEKINPPLVEKMIHALSLVELLATNGLDFIFKGGTSLILLLNDAGRFSIDIDIITTADRQDLEATLQRICTSTPFTRFELSAHRSYQAGVPKAHYSFFYGSALTAKTDHILLDILYDNHSYPQVHEVPVKSEWLLTNDHYIPVKIPSAESITGDKLTAFAPTTTGILYGKGKEVDIVKQLHDVGKLYHEIKHMDIVAKAFNLMVEKEIAYRGHSCTRDEVIMDIITTGLLIARREKNTREPDVSHFKEIKTGLLQFKSYQTNTAFRIDEAITASAKAALLVTKIQAAHIDALPLFHRGMQKSDFLIQHPDYMYLNKLPPEPLYYWSQAISFLHPK
jgi:hypothetical protein